MKMLLGILAFCAFNAANADCSDPNKGCPAAESTAPKISRFILQIGTFDDDAAAMEWAAKLRTAGVLAYVENRRQPDGSMRALLRAGPFQTRAAASAALVIVRAQGLGGGTPATSSKEDHPDQEAQDQTVKLFGDGLRYPRGATEAAMLAAVPSLSCFTFQGERMCSTKVQLFEQELIGGLPGTCTIGKSVTASFEHDHLHGIGCDIVRGVAESVIRTETQRYGEPKSSATMISGMRVETAEWKAGRDFVTLVSYSGNDAYGNPVDAFTLHMGSAATPTAQ